jgi:hypothetical protein
MWNKIIFILLFGQAGFLFAQQIDSVKIIPLNPTSVDSIYVITSVTMATTANGYLGYELNSVGTTSTIEACYKHGALDAPQTYIDTINLGVKAIGAYTLNFFAYTTYFIPCDHSDTSDFQTNFIVTTPLAIHETESEFTFRLFPNPINSISRLEFNLIEDSEVQLGIRDSQGRIVKMIVATTLEAGKHQIDLDMTDLSSGIYFIELSINGRQYSEKLIKQ